MSLVLFTILLFLPLQLLISSDANLKAGSRLCVIHSYTAPSDAGGTAMLDYILLYLHKHSEKELDWLIISNVGTPLIEAQYQRKENTGTRVTVVNHPNRHFQDEAPTLKLIHSISLRSRDVSILYIQTLGNSYPIGHPFLPTMMDWINYLLYFVVRSHALCAKALTLYEIAGCNYESTPSPKFSGNFWWARSSYIQKLDISMLETLGAASWPFSGNPLVYEIHNSGVNHSITHYPFEEYWFEDILSSWKGHRRFAEWLVSEMRPGQVVELGVDLGYSLFTFASALRKVGSEGTIIGIDCFDCDKATYARDTQQLLLQRIERDKYTNIHLVRSTFGDVAETWRRDGKRLETIDVLHIDGNHNYDSVNADFETFFPFVKDGGVILFHDTNVTELGVKDLFAEISGGQKLVFNHSYGLGVFVKAQNQSLFSRILMEFPSSSAFVEYAQQNCQTHSLNTLAQ